MKPAIIFKNKEREFQDIAVGEFFIYASYLFLKTNDETAFDIQGKVYQTYNPWDEVIEPKVTITVET